VHEPGERILPSGLPDDHPIEVVLGPPHEARVGRCGQELGESLARRRVAEEVDPHVAGGLRDLGPEEVVGRADLEPDARHDAEETERDGDRLEEVLLLGIGVVPRDLVNRAGAVDEADLEEVVVDGILT
jgi:hypothetical protein